MFVALLERRNKRIRIDKPTPLRIIVPTPQIVQPHLLIKHIPAIPKRLHLAQRLRKSPTLANRRAPRIVAVADDGIAILIQNCNNIALQALDVGIRRAIVHHHCRAMNGSAVPWWGMKLKGYF